MPGNARKIATTRQVSRVPSSHLSLSPAGKVAAMTESSPVEFKLAQQSDDGRK
jgi:hypothetical protein